MSRENLSLSQRRHNYFYFLLVFSLLMAIFQFESAEAYSFGVSPPSVDLDFDSFGEKCVNFEIYGRNSFINIRDYWSLKESKDIDDYLLNEISGVKITYPEGVYVRDKESIEFCVEILEEGKYYGLILFSPENSNAEIGVWMTAIYGSSELNNADFKGLTGRVVDEEGLDRPIGSRIVILLALFSTFLLILFLFVLIFRLMRLNRELLSK